MSAADEEHAAHNLARAIADLRALESFNCPAAHDESLRVTWARGAALGGYDEMAAAISKIVAERWDDLRDEALARVHKRVRDARTALAAELAKAGL